MINFDSKPEFLVQYKDNAGVWCNVASRFTEYGEALDKLVTEAKADPEYTHRIVRMEVLSYVQNGGYPDV